MKAFILKGSEMRHVRYRILCFTYEEAVEWQKVLNSDDIVEIEYNEVKK